MHVSFATFCVEGFAALQCARRFERYFLTEATAK